MSPVGHLALGYLIGVFICRLTEEEFSIPLIWAVSISPDVDFFIPFVKHRGPTHSVLVAIAVFIPIFLRYGRGLPYFGALASHSLIGDYFTAYGCKMFWPLYGEWVRAPSGLLIWGSQLYLVEGSLFILMLIVYFLNSKKPI